MPDLSDLTLPPTGSSPVRVRFCPSPTGNPHVGMVRTALFNWAYARHTGGTFVFRIEDTDSARDSEQSYDDLLGALRWLGLDWDEGPEVGGPHEPYRQSQRLDLYSDVAAKLLAGGLAYESFSTPDEVEERRRANGEDPKLGYDNKDRDLTDDEKAAFRAEGRLPVLRMRMPDQDWVWDDLVRGEIDFKREHVPDYVIVRGNGEPLYTLVNPVDDALMGITHVLRGEDLLSSTPRQLAMYDALAQIGVGDGSTPRFGHLPYVMGEGNKKLSKRDPQSSLNLYRERGLPARGAAQLPRAARLVGRRRPRVLLAAPSSPSCSTSTGSSPTRRASTPRSASPSTATGSGTSRAADLARRMRALPRRRRRDRRHPERRRSSSSSTPPCRSSRSGWRPSGPAPSSSASSSCRRTRFEVDAEDRERVLTAEARPALQAAYDCLATLEPFGHVEIEAALRAALVEGLGLKPKVAFAPVRVAVSGRRISPPLFESIELLGRDRTLGRLSAALR